MTSILQAIALVLIAGLMMFAFAFFAVWGIALILVVTAVFGIAYLCNITFKVISNGKKIGTYTRKGGYKPL